jgi:NitT/TauT family transport system substrate-binding protein
VRRVAAGGADVCLTSVAHYLKARAQSGPLAARFVTVVSRRSPMAAIVRSESPIAGTRDLPGRRVGGTADNGLVAEYVAGLAELGLEGPRLVGMDYADAPAALGRGEIDVVADYADLVPRVRRQSGTEVRAVPLGLELYSNGLVAADRVPTDVVTRLRAAMAEALRRQGADPKSGLEELGRRYPEVDPADAVEGWTLAAPNILTGAEPGSMDHTTWARTIRWAAAAHGVPAPDPSTVYRPELATPVRGATDS